MKLKQSIYNYIYDDLGENQVVFYNAFTGALAVVKAEQYQQFKDYFKSGKEFEDKEFYHQLLANGYILAADVDERFLVKTRLMQGRYDASTLSLTIAPTMACNFRCVYCFEQGHYGNHLMDEATQEHLMAFIKRHAKGIKSLFITWFGGEPLVGMSVIEKLSEQIIAFCDENKINYSADIVTNGYLLTKDVAEKLKSYKVRSAQVTIDGPKEIHDARRPMANGQGTYDVVINNLLDVQGIIPISLRINVDYNNLDAADQMMNILKEIGLTNKVYPYLGLVTPEAEGYEKDKCFSNEYYSKINLKFLLDHNLPLQSSYPRPRSRCCGADSNYSWVVDDEGYLYKCWNDIGIHDCAAGNINDPDITIHNTSLLAGYASFDPMLISECSDCKLLPVCLGGCPHKRLHKQNSCEQWKYCMQEYLVACAKEVLAQRAREKLVKETEAV